MERQFVGKSISDIGTGRRQVGIAATSAHRRDRRSSLSLADGAEGALPVPPRALGTPDLRAQVTRGCSVASAQAVRAGADGLGAEDPFDVAVSPRRSRSVLRLFGTSSVSVGGPIHRVAPSRRHRTHLALATLCASLVSLALTATPALAVTRHVLQPASSYPFEGLTRPTGLALDQSGNSVYVVDQGADAIDKYNTSGTPEDFSALGSSQISIPHRLFMMAVDNSGSSSAGDLYVGSNETHNVLKYDSDGEPDPITPEIGPIENSSGIAVDGSGDVYVADYSNGSPSSGSVYKFDPTGHPVDFSALGTNRIAGLTGPTALVVDSQGNLYVGTAEGTHEFDSAGTPLTTLDGTEFDLGVGIDPTNDHVFIAPDGAAAGAISEYDSAANSNVFVETFGAGVFNIYSYGIAALNTNGNVYASDAENHSVHVFRPVVLPDVATGEATDLTPTTATLEGHINPAGGGDITECKFEYGGTTSYGHTASCETTPPSTLPYSAATDVHAELTGLLPGTTYHYRLDAADANGGNNGEDQTYTTAQAPSIAGLTSSNLSETTANLNAKINPNEADTTYHFEYGTTTAYGSSVPVPDADIGSGDSEQSVTAHLSALQSHATYHFRVVAENKWGTTTTEDQTFNFLPANCPNASLRQQTGASYLPDCRAYELVSPPRAGNIIFFLGGGGLAAPDAESPARFAFTGIFGAVSGTDPPNSDDTDTYVATRTDNGWVTNYVGIRGDEAPSAQSAVGSINLEKLIDFTEREAFDVGVPQPPSRLPYAWEYNGSSLGRWPSDGPDIPNAEDSEGAFQPSPNFTHLAFSSNNVAFNAEGITTGLGSAYDYNTVAGTTTLISKTASGGNIELEPTNSGGATEYLRFPARVEDPETLNPSVSTDGSHILMSTFATPQARFGYFTYPTPPAGRLYMRVNDAVTYEVSQGQDVHYVGMTADGSKVFFTSDDQLTSEDHDTSTDIYMWSEATNSLTLLSKGTEGSGNSDGCNAQWTTQCGVVAVTGAVTGDSAIASKTGEIYFYSPEQLDGDKGVENGENLYVFREGEARFVATAGPLTRVQVSPDGSHAAFVTSSQLTAANTAGFQEMYSYVASTGKIVCVSCNPNGDPPTGDVAASLDGLFMSDDGRTFFDSPDALVPQDTDKLPDIYEYVEGRPQLITSGTETEATLTTPNQVRESGLEGVSADGANVYFATYDSLVSQDENGEFLKFYDARTDGGFPFVPPPAPCAAADECHGAGSSPPSSPTITSGSDFGLGGNAHPGAGRRKSKRSKRQARTHKHHRQRKQHRHG